VNKIIIIIACFLFAQTGMTQIQKVPGKKIPPGKLDPTTNTLVEREREVTVYADANFAGESIILKPGVYTMAELNDKISSVKVPPGIVAVIYEHVYNGAGYGRYTELMEDCTDLSVYDLDDKLSFINIFYASKDIYDYARGRLVNNQYVNGHWERQRVNGAKPENSPPAAVSVLPDPRIKPVTPVNNIDESIPVSRIQLRIVTGNGENDNEDKEVIVKLNNDDADYYLDYGPDDFERGSDRRYDIISKSIKTIADIKQIKLMVKGDDVWGIEKVELYLNNASSPVFSSTYREPIHINSTGNYPRFLIYTEYQLRSNTFWQRIPSNEALRNPPVPIPASMIRSMVESMVGNLLHQQEDHDLYWGNTNGANTVWGDHVEMKRLDGNTLHFDLDLQYEVTGTNPEIDVDFDLYFECKPNGSVSIETRNITTGCEVLGLVSCQKLLKYINAVVTTFGFAPFAAPSSNASSTFSNVFTLKPPGFSCKGVLVNPNGDVFIY
jgi:hypothetical protein